MWVESGSLHQQCANELQEHHNIPLLFEFLYLTTVVFIDTQCDIHFSDIIIVSLLVSLRMFLTEGIILYLAYSELCYHYCDHDTPCSILGT